jgi:hypothetical protein
MIDPASERGNVAAELGEDLGELGPSLGGRRVQQSLHLRPGGESADRLVRQGGMMVEHPVKDLVGALPQGSNLGMEVRGRQQLPKRFETIVRHAMIG